MTRPAILNDRHYTYADYLKFPEDERWEIIDGVAYLLEGSPNDRDARAMAPSPAFEHQSVSTELVRQIGNQLLGKPCRVVTAPLDVRLDTSNENASVVQPDVMVICDVGKITRQGVLARRTGSSKSCHPPRPGVITSSNAISTSDTAFASTGWFIRSTES